MEDEKYLLVSINDEKSKNLAEVISNKTCKKIVNLLTGVSEKELSETDIAKKLGLPVNTTEYNLKKLVEAGLVEKSKGFFWSMRGKKIPMYKLSKKFIVILPKSTSAISASKILKSIVPVVLISAAGALLIKTYYSVKAPLQVFKDGTDADMAVASADIGKEMIRETAPDVFPYLASGFQNYWLFFLAGALTALLIFLVLNWKDLK